MPLNSELKKIDYSKSSIQKTAGGIKYAVLDQRMQGNLAEREPILKALEELGVEVKKLK